MVPLIDGALALCVEDPGFNTSTEKSFDHCDASNFVLHVKTLIPIFTTKAAGFWQSALNLQVSLCRHLNISQTVNMGRCPCLFFLLSFPSMSFVVFNVQVGHFLH